MTSLIHPDDALFAGEKPFPAVPVCEHFAGTEKLILKAMAMQDSVGPVFDITCDCEDGAPAGKEQEHAEMIVRVQRSDANAHRMAGVRIHDYTHGAWRRDVDILVEGIGDITAYVTIPKTTEAGRLREMVAYVQSAAGRYGVTREIPLHVLIETHGALRDVWQIAGTDWVQVLDFGLMDFVSGHHGAIPASAMRSPGQFEHHLLARAKTEVVAAALANGRVPAHNVTLDLKNPYNTYLDARRARQEFGFAMAPDHSEVVDGAAILLAAQRADWGPIQYAGELHDRATYRYFWDLLRRAHAAGTRLPDDAEKAFFG